MRPHAAARDPAPGQRRAVTFGGVTLDEICTRHHIKPSTWRAYVARGQAPKPTGYDPTTGRRVWDDAQIAAWAATRPGQGARTDRTRKEQPPP